MNLLYSNDTQGNYPESWYSATAEPLSAFPNLKGSKKYDICIVGAGYTGLSSALHLSNLGYSVAVLDAHRVGFGASGRNGGQLGAGQRVYQDELVNKVGENNADKMWHLANDAVSTVKEIIKTNNIDCHIKPGVATLGFNSNEVKELHNYAEYLEKRYSYKGLELLSQADCNTLCCSEKYTGGILDMNAAHLHPLRFVFGLAKAAVLAGTNIFEQSEVIQLIPGKVNRTITKVGEIQSDFVVLGCNGYLGNLETKVAAKVMPINNFIIATEPLGKRTGEVLTKDIAVADTKFVVNYFRLSKDKRLLFGGGENYSYKFPKNITSTVLKPMLEIFPQLSDVKIDYAWGGTLGITRQRMPYFCRVTDTILSVSGYSGHGLGTATHAGKLISMAINGQQDGFNTMASIPIKSFPGGARYKTPLLILAMSWYALRDKLGI
jgi:gamma-glutamylputrescine oxidase